MLRKVADESVGKEVHIVLDNARYQKCRIAQELAGQLGIQFEYIPPYSPNLNLIERVCKFIKGEISSKYYHQIRYGMFSHLFLQGPHSFSHRSVNSTASLTGIPMARRIIATSFFAKVTGTNNYSIFAKSSNIKA